MLKTSLKKAIVKAESIRFLNQIMGRLRVSQVPIFMLHRMQDSSRGVNGHSAKFLDDALRHLYEHGYHFLALSDLVSSLNAGLAVPKNSVVFTMDDGFYDQVEIAGPIFEKYKCPVTIFLLSESSSGISWPWDYQLEHILNTTSKEKICFSDDQISLDTNLDNDSSRHKALNEVRDRLYRYPTHKAKLFVHEFAKEAEVELNETSPPLSCEAISWQVARHYESDLIRFGPHTANHSVLASQEDDISFREISDCWEKIKKEISNPVPVMCYPIGRKDLDFGSREMKYVKSLGLQGGLSTNPGYVDLNKRGLNEYPYALPRFGFPNNMYDFIQLCSWIEALKEKIRGN